MSAAGLSVPGNAAVTGTLTVPTLAGAVDVTGNLTVGGTIRGASWGFGGMYTLYVGARGAVCGTGSSFAIAQSVNPITGGQSCPAGFTDSVILSANYCLANTGSVGYDTHMCWK